MSLIWNWSHHTVYPRKDATLPVLALYVDRNPHCWLFLTLLLVLTTEVGRVIKVFEPGLFFSREAGVYILQNTLVMGLLSHLLGLNSVVDPGWNLGISERNPSFWLYAPKIVFTFMFTNLFLHRLKRCSGWSDPDFFLNCIRLGQMFRPDLQHHALLEHWNEYFLTNK